jgi:hypothetical protein
MSYDVAWEKAVEDMQGIRPYVVASMSGADYDGGRFRLPFFNRTFIITYPEVRVEEPDEESTPPQWLQVLLLHYLLNAKGVPVADEWIAYRQLPGGNFFERRFMNMAVNPLRRAFGNDIESFKGAGSALGGMPMSRAGNAAFRFLALPRIPIACIFYLGEEEIPSSVNILFDAASYTYLPTEDLSLVGVYLSYALQGYKKHKAELERDLGTGKTF